MGLGVLPQGANWVHILGTGLLAGIGFTMSMFIANLGFQEKETLEIGKAAILMGSVTAGVAPTSCTKLRQQ